MNIRSLYATIGTQQVALADTRAFIETHEALFHQLERLGGLKCAITPGELTFSVSDPYNLLRIFVQHFKIIFSRELTAQVTYNWVSCWGAIRLVIEAGEVHDASGTVVTTN